LPEVLHGNEADGPVLIDQVGGRVVWLDRRHEPVYPSGPAFGNPALGLEAAQLRPHLIAAVVCGFIPAFEFKNESTQIMCGAIWRGDGQAPDMRVKINGEYARHVGRNAYFSYARQRGD
jgi:hypothetical protein